MKLVTFASIAGPARLGVLDGQEVVDLAAVAARLGRDGASVGSALDLLRGGTAGRLLAAELTELSRGDEPGWRWARAAVRLRAPLPNPRAIYCLAGNYAEHWREAGLSAPSKQGFAPQLFLKPAGTIVGPSDPIRLPGDICTAVDYEGELAAVIGTRGYRIPASRALEHVAAYANFDDVSGRRLNIAVERPDNPRTGYFDWMNGKWFDTFGPLGPWLVTADEVPDPQALAIETRVNGQVRQRATTADMIFTVAETIAWLSQFVALEPGDVIATGTPSGVGSSTGQFLQPGDLVEVEVAGMGVLSNPVVAPHEGGLTSRSPPVSAG